VTFRILLAEDEQVMREYLARALERSGYEVVAVDSGTAAAPLLEAERFDLLLTDIIMPEMDGIQLAQYCNMVSPTTDVIFITGFSGVALRAGASIPNAKILAKPFHLKDLVLEVERLFAKESCDELK
jgi:two-component system cell cycle response regulator CpdR